MFFLSCESSKKTTWWKGNLHTHSLWSDGDDFPEMIIDWYKSNGYDFLALSDHNVLPTEERWIEVHKESNRYQVYQEYLVRFGSDWVEVKDQDSLVLVRLKTLSEYDSLFEKPGQFLMIPSEEITDRFERKPIHVNATNLAEFIPPQGGNSVLEVMQNNINAVLQQRERTGQLMFPHLNHPNFGWAVKVEDIIALEGERFFEVYNGHPAVHNEGDELHPSTERMWDIVLTANLERGAEPLYGMAVDDAHNYRDLDSNHSNPGRGWVMVKTDQLTPEAIITAMESGDFYSSSGVVLQDIQYSDNTIYISIQTEEGVTYSTQFIGTRKGYIPSLAATLETETASVTRYYSAEIGEVFLEVQGISPSYTWSGDEIYVRAKVISSKLKENPYKEGEMEAAWVQPFVIRKMD
ncbi:histidinol-phosphatase [candidate division KSB1 bacterium]|nr:histidinol-phosphatase [candidate division KSB1 bacterium]